VHEVLLSGRKLFLTLVGLEKLSLVEAETQLPHITGVCTVSPGGTVFRPMIILKQLEILESLAQFTHLASFASSVSGWMTSDLFAVFAIDFCARLSLHRLALPPTLAQRPVLLIIAGDNTRMNLTASLVFRQSNVDVLVLQVLHPVVAGLSAPLTARFKKLLKNQVGKLLEQLTDGQQLTVESLQCSMVAAFLNAFRREAIPGILRLAFEATGFYPFDPDRPPTSPVDEGHPPGTFDRFVTAPSPAAAQLLTDPNSLAERFSAEVGRPITDDDVTGLNIDEIWNAVADGSLENGRILTPTPKIWMMESEVNARLI
jgi:hypothetical protein